MCTYYSELAAYFRRWTEEYVAMQARARKLRIFNDEVHSFAKHPQLTEWQMPERRLRANKEYYELPEGFEPMNPEAYRKRFWHMMSPEQREKVLKLEKEQQSELA